MSVKWIIYTACLQNKGNAPLNIFLLKKSFNEKLVSVSTLYIALKVHEVN